MGSPAPRRQFRHAPEIALQGFPLRDRRLTYRMSGLDVQFMKNLINKQSTKETLEGALDSGFSSAGEPHGANGRPWGTSPEPQKTLRDECTPG